MNFTFHVALVHCKHFGLVISLERRMLLLNTLLGKPNKGDPHRLCIEIRGEGGREREREREREGKEGGREGGREGGMDRWMAGCGCCGRAKCLLPSASQPACNTHPLKSLQSAASQVPNPGHTPAIPPYPTRPTASQQQRQEGAAEGSAETVPEAAQGCPKPAWKGDETGSVL